MQRKLLKVAVPAFLCQFLAIFQETINMWFAGSLNDLSMISAIGLGNTFVNLFGYATVFGLNGALSTFASQSAGSKEYQQCGVLRWRARYVMIFALALTFPFFLFSSDIMKLCKQNPEVSDKAQEYLLLMYPAVLLLGLLDVDRNILASLERSDISLYAQAISPFIHTYFCF